MTTKVEDLTDAELDALVEEKVMGWERETDAGATPWRPSTNIGNAFQVDKPEWEWRHEEYFWKQPLLLVSIWHKTEFSIISRVTIPLDLANKTAAYCRGRCIAACYACGVTEVE